MDQNATSVIPLTPETGSFIQTIANMVAHDGSRASTATLALKILLPLGLIFLLKRLVFPTFDTREPPVLRPRVPIVGHIISMIREKTSWHARLFAEHSMPICTLPMLNGKMYVINSPSLITAALRNNDISFEPFPLELSSGIMGITARHLRIIEPRPIQSELMHAIHSSLTGEPLSDLYVAALETLALTLNRIKPGTTLAVPDSFLWLRKLMTLATMTALFGEKNPIMPEHVDLLWEFDKGVALLSVGHLPHLLAPKSFAARKELNNVLRPFYANHHDERSDVSALVQRRSVILRREGCDDLDLSIMELTMPWASTTNTVPTACWFFVRLFSDSEYVKRVRAEVENIVTIGVGEQGRVATIAASQVDKQCPVLLRIYREVLRKYVHSVGIRRVMKDSTITDADGREYLLRKGTNVQWATSVTHELESAWGDDAGSFNPERFNQTTTTPQENQRRRAANLAFGGGKNLCPGRSFALAENLGFLGALALGFEVKGVQVPGSEDPLTGNTLRRPVWGSTDRGINISRRSGWEDVTWKFVH